MGSRYYLRRDLVEMELHGFGVAARKYEVPPKTEALANQKIETLVYAAKWLLASLEEGCIDGQDPHERRLDQAPTLGYYSCADEELTCAMILNK